MARRLGILSTGEQRSQGRDAQGSAHDQLAYMKCPRPGISYAVSAGAAASID